MGNNLSDPWEIWWLSRLNLTTPPYIVPDPKRMLINISNELNDICKELLKEELKNELIVILMEKLQEKFKQNIQNQLKKYLDDTKEKTLRRQKKLHELREDFNKLQSETKETIKKEI
jgi:predicted nuclease with TOPRIM domain